MTTINPTKRWAERAAKLRACGAREIIFDVNSNGDGHPTTSQWVVGPKGPHGSIMPNNVWMDAGTNLWELEEDVFAILDVHVPSWDNGDGSHCRVNIDLLDGSIVVDGSFRVLTYEDFDPVKVQGDAYGIAETPVSDNVVETG